MSQLRRHIGLRSAPCDLSVVASELMNKIRDKDIKPYNVHLKMIELTQPYKIDVRAPDLLTADR